MPTLNKLLPFPPNSHVLAGRAWNPRAEISDNQSYLGVLNQGTQVLLRDPGFTKAPRYSQAFSLVFGRNSEH
jgi:hypothetical protein